MSRIVLAFIPLIIILFLSARNWRRSLYAVFILVVIEGALRKWFLPQFSDLLYFLKDLVLLGAYLHFFFFSENTPKLKFQAYFIKGFLLLVTGWCIFQAFNPSLGSPIVGFFGLRGYLFYIPLMWLVPNLFQSQDDLYKTLRHYLLLVIPVGLLGIIQFYSPASSPLNIYAGGVDPTAGFSGTDNLRITGTFPYISGYAVYLSVCFALLIPLLLKPQPSLWQGIITAEVAIVVVNSLMTGSRGVILFEVLFLISFVILTVLRRPNRMMNYLKRFTLPIFISTGVLTQWLRPAFDAFAARATGSDSIVGRVMNSFAVLQYFQFKGLDGYGVGATHQAVNVLRGVLGLPYGEPIPIGFESEMGRIALELGPIGFILWYVFRILVIGALFNVFWKLRHPFLQDLALAAFLTHLIQFSGQLVVHNVFSIYYWSLAGFIILLPNLEHTENQYFASSLSNPYATVSHFSSSGNR